MSGICVYMCRSGVVALNYVVSLLYSSVALSLRRWQHGEQKRAPLTLEDHQFSTLWPVSTTILNTGIEGRYSVHINPVLQLYSEFTTFDLQGTGTCIEGGIQYTAFLCYSCIKSLRPLTYIPTSCDTGLVVS